MCPCRVLGWEPQDEDICVSLGGVQGQDLLGMGAMSLEDAWGWDPQNGDVVPSAGCFGVAVWWQDIWG